MSNDKERKIEELIESSRYLTICQHRQPAIAPD